MNTFSPRVVERALFVYFTWDLNGIGEINGEGEQRAILTQNHSLH